jgi:hypothetical protein
LKLGCPFRNVKVHILEYIFGFIGLEPHPNRNPLEQLNLLAEYKFNAYILDHLIFVHKFPS